MTSKAGNDPYNLRRKLNAANARRRKRGLPALRAKYEKAMAETRAARAAREDE